MSNMLSIREIFGDLIILRDLEFRGRKFPGHAELHQSVGLPKEVVPRKSEMSYAKIVDVMLSNMASDGAKAIVYVGDTYMNDGRVVWNLTSQDNRWILGFLCRENTSQPAVDFLLGNIILSNRWSSIWKLARGIRSACIELGPSLVGLFDLDQTVYAAKGRNDEALKRARLEAVHSIIHRAVGEALYDYEKVERLYREFDQDRYHSLTGDNQDFVVVLTLAGVLGLYDVDEVRNKMLESDCSMLSIVAGMRMTLEKRGARTQLRNVWEFIREVYFNLGADDRTPCKSFRKEEYATTAKRMSRSCEENNTIKRGFDPSEDIGLTRPVVDFIDFLKKGGATVVALSDRPVESTEPNQVLDEGGVSLLDIQMTLYGDSVRETLESFTQ